MKILTRGSGQVPQKKTKETKYGPKKGMTPPGSHATNTKGA